MAFNPVKGSTATTPTLRGTAKAANGAASGVLDVIGVAASKSTVGLANLLVSWGVRSEGLVAQAEIDAIVAEERREHEGAMSLYEIMNASKSFYAETGIKPGSKEDPKTLLKQKLQVRRGY